MTYLGTNQMDAANATERGHLELGMHGVPNGRDAYDNPGRMVSGYIGGQQIDDCCKYKGVRLRTTSYQHCHTRTLAVDSAYLSGYLQDASRRFHRRW